MVYAPLRVGDRELLNEGSRAAILVVLQGQGIPVIKFTHIYMEETIISSFLAVKGMSATSTNQFEI